MNARLSFTSTLALLALTGVRAASAGAQTPAPNPNAEPPATLLSSPAMWDRSDTSGACPATAKTFSIICALERASHEAARAARDRALPATAGGRVECRFRREQGHEE